MKELLVRHKQKIVYLLTGGWNTLFGYVSFVVLYRLLSQTFNYSLILTFSYILSITNSYVGYKLFVFKTKGNIVREYFRFYLVYGGAFIVNLILFPVLTGVLMVNAYLAQGIIVFMTVVSSYVFHNKFTFKDSGYKNKR